MVHIYKLDSGKYTVMNPANTQALTARYAQAVDDWNHVAHFCANEVTDPDNIKTLYEQISNAIKIGDFNDKEIPFEDFGKRINAEIDKNMENLLARFRERQKANEAPERKSEPGIDENHRISDLSEIIKKIKENQEKTRTGTSSKDASKRRDRDER